MRFGFIFITVCIFLVSCTATPPLPDLQILEAHLPYLPCLGWAEPIYLEVSIQNKGGADAIAFTVGLQQDNGFMSSITVDGLAAGESLNLQFPDGLDILSGGEFVIILDTMNQVHEINESNNQLGLSLDAPTSLSLCSTVEPTALPLMPDLVIVRAVNGIRPECLNEGVVMAIEFWIENRGDAPAPPFEFAINALTVHVEMELLPHEMISIIQPTIEDTWFNGYSVNADPNNHIEESDESNNSTPGIIYTLTPPGHCEQLPYNPHLQNIWIIQTSTPRANFTPPSLRD